VANGYGVAGGACRWNGVEVFPAKTSRKEAGRITKALSRRKAASAALDNQKLDQHRGRIERKKRTAERKKRRRDKSSI